MKKLVLTPAVLFISSFMFSMHDDQEDIISLILDERIEEAITAIQQGACTNTTDSRGLTPLHHAICAIESRNVLKTYTLFRIFPRRRSLLLSLIQSLILHGANLNAQNNYGETPLYLAATPEVTALLLEHGARVDIKRNGKENPSDQLPQTLNTTFYVPFRNAIKHEDQPTIKRMLNQGAAVGWREIGLAAEHPIAQWKYEGHGIRPSTLELLLTHPLPGAVSESPEIICAKKEWFVFACILNRKKVTNELNLPPDIRKLLRARLFPPLKDFVALVPTTSLARYIALFGKNSLLDAAITRHLDHVRAILNQPKETGLPNQSKNVLSRKAVCDIIDPHKIDTSLGPLIRRSYEKLFENQKADH